MERDSLGGARGESWKSALRRSLLALALFAAVVTYARARSGRQLATSGLRTLGRRVVPPGVKIRVEVLNATDTRGLARQATFFLRDAGFDVVYFGTSPERAESTVVIDRSGHPHWAVLAAGALAPARIEEHADSSHFLDLTVLVGRRWPPPRETLYP